MQNKPTRGIVKDNKLPQVLNTSSLFFFQNCFISTLKQIKGLKILQNNVLVSGAKNNHYKKKKRAVKISYIKSFHIDEKKLNSKLV